MFITSSWCILFSGSEFPNKLMNKLNSEFPQVPLSFTRYRMWSKMILNNKSIINNLKNSLSIIIEVNAIHVFVIIQNTWWSGKNQIIPFLCARISSDVNVTQEINWLSIHPNCRHHSTAVILSNFVPRVASEQPWLSQAILRF